jgi:hypothetical protein
MGSRDAAKNGATGENGSASQALVVAQWRVCDGDRCPNMREEHRKVIL